MTEPDIRLLTYDDAQIELGMTPWLTFEDYMEEQAVGPKAHRRIVTALARANRRATEQFQDPTIEQEDYESPFLFVTGSSEVFTGTDLSREAGVDIALDTLHGFIAVGAFKIEFIKRDKFKHPDYYRGVGVATRTPIVSFVNDRVAAAINS